MSEQSPWLMELFGENDRNSKRQPPTECRDIVQEKDTPLSALSGVRRERQNGLGAHALG